MLLHVTFDELMCPSVGAKVGLSSAICVAVLNWEDVQKYRAGLCFHCCVIVQKILNVFLKRRLQLKKNPYERISLNCSKSFLSLGI